MNCVQSPLETPFAATGAVAGTTATSRSPDSSNAIEANRDLRASDRPRLPDP